jgi:methionyl aminopeptidase
MLRQAGRMLAQVMDVLKGHITVGVSTGEIDVLAQELIVKHRAIAAFKGYRGYPANTCISINEEIVHGIPGPRRIIEGDIVSVDVGINYEGYFADAAFTVGVGKIDSRSKKLIAVTRQALLEGIQQARSDNHLLDISHAIQRYVENNGFSVVREFVGHGIGRALHEAPEIPNFGLAGRGPVIKSGMVFAIEPMVNAGTWKANILENSWTAVTADGLPSAHFEHTVAVTDGGCEVLTR